MSIHKARKNSSQSETNTDISANLRDIRTTDYTGGVDCATQTKWT